MKKQLMIVGIIVILLAVGLSGCNEDNNTVQSDEEKIIGTWVYEGSNDLHTDSFIFYNNGSVYCIYHWPGSTILEYQWNGYTIVENKLKIGESVYEYAFSNNDNTLTITMVGTTTPEVFNKQLE